MNLNFIVIIKKDFPLSFQHGPPGIANLVQSSPPPPPPSTGTGQQGPSSLLQSGDMPPPPPPPDGSEEDRYEDRYASHRLVAKFLKLPAR